MFLKLPQHTPSRAVQAAAAVLEAWTLRSGYPIIGRAYLRVSEITSTHPFPCSEGCCGGIGGVDAEKRLPDYRGSPPPCFLNYQTHPFPLAVQAAAAALKALHALEGADSAPTRPDEPLSSLAPSPKQSGGDLASAVGSAKGADLADASVLRPGINPPASKLSGGGLAGAAINIPGDAVNSPAAAVSRPAAAVNSSGGQAGAGAAVNSPAAAVSSPAAAVNSPGGAAGAAVDSPAAVVNSPAAAVNNPGGPAGAAVNSPAAAVNSSGGAAERCALPEWLTWKQSPTELAFIFEVPSIFETSLQVRAYILNTRNEEKNTVFYSYLACFVKQLTGHTHTGHTDRENTPDTGTHTRTTRPPNEHLPQALNNAQLWRDDGACHLPRPGRWPRRSQHER